MLGPVLICSLALSPFHASSANACDSVRHTFSEDAQLFNSAPPAEFGFFVKQTEQLRVEHVKGWMRHSKKLKLNGDKTEAMTVGKPTHPRTRAIHCLLITTLLLTFTAQRSGFVFLRRLFDWGNLKEQVDACGAI